MSFVDDIARFCRLAKQREKALYKQSVEHAFRSIRFGSDVTGAPGQPVKEGVLLASWEMRQAGNATELETPLEYGPIIEDNFRGATLRSEVGGFHSVKLTRLGWRRIVAYENQRLTGDTGKPQGAPRLGSSQIRDARGRFTSAKKSAHFRVIKAKNG